MADPISLTAAGALAAGGAAGGAGAGAGVLAGIGTGATILGGITGAISKVMGGESQGNMYAYQAGVSRINQQIAKQNADYSRYVGEVEAQRVGMKGRFERGQTLVTQSGRGIDVGSGSNAEVRDSMQDMNVHDQATTRSNAMRRAYGHDVEAIKHETQGQMYGMAGSKARTAGYIDAFGSILGTASSVSSKWLDASRLGIGSGRGISLGPSPDFPSAEYEF